MSIVSLLISCILNFKVCMCLHGFTMNISNLGAKMWDQSCENELTYITHKMPTPLKAPIGWNESTHKKVCLYSIVAGQPFATVAQQCIDPNTNKSTFDSSSALQYRQQRVSNLCKFIVQCIILLNVRQTRRRLTYICCCIVKACRNFKSGKPRSRHNPLPRGFDLNNIGFTTNLPPITTEQYRNQFPSNTMARTKSKSTQASGSKSTKAAGMKTRFRFPPTGIHSPSFRWFSQLLSRLHLC